MTNISLNPHYNSLLGQQRSSVDVSAASISTRKDGWSQTADSVSLRSESSWTVTYSGAMQLNGDDDARFGMLRDLVVNLLQEQGINTKIAVGDTTIHLAAVTPDEAQELVSEDGYFGVEQTSERIFQFAVGIAGGDTSRIDAIKEGIEQGFAEAEKAFGDRLPDISYDTYDAVMNKLDKWVADFQAAV